jgi:hypothetical protein
MNPQKTGKQLTFDGFPKTTPKVTPELPKEIQITEFTAQPGIDELTLKVAFKLAPSRTVFSKIKADLYFCGEPVNSTVLRIPQGALASDESEYKVVLDMAGVEAGKYIMKTEVYEQTGNAKKPCLTVKELMVDYVPQTRQSRWVKIPMVKSVVGTEVVVASEEQNALLTEREITLRREQESRRDSY